MCSVPQKKVIPWYGKKDIAFERKMIFKQDNDPSHAARYIIESLAILIIKNEKIMIWSPSSLYLNPMVHTEKEDLGRWKTIHVKRWAVAGYNSTSR